MSVLFGVRINVFWVRIWTQTPEFICLFFNLISAQNLDWCACMCLYLQSLFSLLSWKISSIGEYCENRCIYDASCFTFIMRHVWRCIMFRNWTLLGRSTHTQIHAQYFWLGLERVLAPYIVMLVVTRNWGISTFIFIFSSSCRFQLPLAGVFYFIKWHKYTTVYKISKGQKSND